MAPFYVSMHNQNTCFDLILIDQRVVGSARLSSMVNMLCVS